MNHRICQAQAALIDTRRPSSSDRPPNRWPPPSVRPFKRPSRQTAASGALRLPSRMAGSVGYPSLRTRPRCRTLAAMPTRQVVVVAFPGVQSLDVTGPVEVFHGAGRAAGGAYEVAVATL